MKSPESKYKYKRADKYVLVNVDDSVVRQVCLQLPKPPDIKYIDGYGLRPEDQYFKRIEEPERLQRLEKMALEQVRNSKDATGRGETITSYKIHQKCWEILEKNKDMYKEEIKYIKKMWWFLVNGYWFFNDGKPTWIPPQYFYYLQWMYIKNSDDYNIIPHRINYRNPDREDAVFDWYSYTTCETFKNLDKDGNALKINGKYEMVEMPNRTCFGIVRPKRRRSGESMKGIIWLRYIAGITFGAKCVITHYSEKDAYEKVYDEMLMISWNKEPFWIKPVHNINRKASGGLIMEAPSNVFDKESLGSKILVDVSSENASDGARLNGGLFDEEGKQSKDVYQKWEINKKTMCQGANIHGFSYHPSTVEEMDAGGEMFERLFNESNFYIRIPGIGQTVSGCFRTFRKSYTNFDGFFDRWGNCVQERPTRKQVMFAPKNAKFLGDNEGAKQYIMHTRLFLEKENTSQSLSKLRQVKRKDPIDSTECFMGSSGDIGFNQFIIDNAISRLKIKSDTTSGNFEWVNGFGSKVEFIPTPTGRWDVSLRLPENKTNQFMIDGEVFSIKRNASITTYKPIYPNAYITYADPFEYSDQIMDTNTGARYSDGGGCTFRRKLLTDNFNKRDEMQGHCFTATYRYRPQSLDEYCEDMLKQYLYYGGLFYFERNKTRIWEYFIDHGYEPCLGYLMDENGEKATKPGLYLQDKSALINELRDYIEFRGNQEKHLRFLLEAKALDTPKKFTKLDLLSACGGALVCNRSVYGDVLQQENSENEIDLRDFEGLFD